MEYTASTEPINERSRRPNYKEDARITQVKLRGHKFTFTGTSNLTKGDTIAIAKLNNRAEVTGVAIKHNCDELSYSVNISTSAPNILGNNIVESQYSVWIVPEKANSAMVYIEIKDGSIHKGDTIEGVIYYLGD